MSVEGKNGYQYENAELKQVALFEAAKILRDLSSSYDEKSGFNLSPYTLKIKVNTFLMLLRPIQDFAQATTIPVNQNMGLGINSEGEIVHLSTVSPSEIVNINRLKHLVELSANLQSNVRNPFEDYLSSEEAREEELARKLAP